MQPYLVEYFQEIKTFFKDFSTPVLRCLGLRKEFLVKLSEKNPETEIESSTMYTSAVTVRAKRKEEIRD